MFEIKDNKYLRAVQDIILNTLLIFFGAIGLFLKIQWAENIFLFGCWLLIVMSFFLLSSEMRESLQKKGRSIPATLAVTIDLVILCMLAADARFIMASFWFIQMALESYGFTIPPNKEESKEKSC